MSYQEKKIKKILKNRFPKYIQTNLSHVTHFKRFFVYFWYTLLDIDKLLVFLIYIYSCFRVYEWLFGLFCSISILVKKKVNLKKLKKKIGNKE